MASAVWVGIKEVQRAFDKVSAEADEAAKYALRKVGADVVKKAMGNFEGSHAKGMAHVGGDKPNIVTGNLRRSIYMESPKREGGDWTIRVGFGAVYGMSVEFGNPRTHSRAFPFFTPAVDASRPGWAGEMAAAYSKFIF